MGRKIIRLLGAISANNSVSIPDPSQGMKSLNLTGRYIYIEFLPVKGRYFTIHFDLQIKERDPLIKLTISNMYDVHKVFHGYISRFNRHNYSFHILRMLQTNGLS